MPDFKVVVVDTKFPSYDRERAILEPLGAVVETHHCRTPAEVLEVAAQADILLVSAVPIDATTITGLKRCRGIIRYGVGYDIVDVAAATASGIPVVNVPDYCTEEVADHTLALILASIRKLPQVARSISQGLWGAVAARPVHAPRGRKLGLLGVGRIGGAVVQRARPFGFAIQAHDPYLSDDDFRELGITSVSFNDLLASSDVLSVHLPMTKETRHVIGTSSLARMKPEAFLINVSRGGLVDESALIDALDNGRIAGAALDVFEREPLEVNSPLLSVENLIVTSHCAWYSEDALARLQEFAAFEAARLLRGESPKHAVNGAW